tara:strand:- start:736 stop:2172 length:1437 start_codon:yes stop_codon:yes gene_type:complete
MIPEDSATPSIDPTQAAGSEVVTEEQINPKLRQLFMKGMSALDQKNFDYTINLLQAVLKEEPRFLMGRKRLREAAIKKKEAESKRINIKTGGIGAMKLQPMVKKDPAAAIVALEKEVLAAEPYNPQGNQLLFDACRAASMPMTAGFALETLVQGNPENTKYMHQLGDFYMDHDFWEQASIVFARITSFDPTDLNATQKEKNATARASMAKQKDGGLRNNLRDAEGAAELEKQNRSGMTRDQLEEQIATYQAKYAEDQNNLQTVKELAALYEQLEDFDSALSYYEWAHTLSNGDVSLEKKVIETRETQRARKIREYEGWLAENEGHADYDTVKADYNEFKGGHFKAQIDAYQEQVDRNPTDNSLRFKLGEALFEAGELKDAIPQLQRAQSSPNLRTKAMLLLGKCYEGRNMNDLAIDQFQKAAAELQIMDDTKKELLYSLGQIHQKVGDKAAALECMKEIYAVDYGYRDVADLVESSYE